jgi:hypothetical protein
MTRPTVLGATAVAVLALVMTSVATASADPAQQRRLVAVTGQGAGIVNVSPTAAHPGLSSEITVNVHDATPNTTFYVQRGAEVGRPSATTASASGRTASGHGSSPTARAFLRRLPS